MNKTLLIFKNELYSTLKRKGFVLTTLALPVLGILALLVYQLVSGLSKPEEEVKITKVGYVDEVGIFADFTNYNELELIQYEGAEEANQSMVRGDIQEYFIIPADYLQSGLVTRFSMKTELETPSNVYNAMRDFLIQNMLQDKVSPELAYRVNYPLGLSTVILDKAGQVTDTRAGFGMYIISYLFSLLLLLSIFTASGYLLQGLSEEKENRIMEVLLSSISTRR
jgi:ABC-2 type transport system permease protein